MNADDAGGIAGTSAGESGPGDYAAVEAAVMETARGRWFLAEFARRNRAADTRLVLAALERLESALGDAAPPAAHARSGIAAIVEKARGDLASVLSAVPEWRRRNSTGVDAAVAVAEESLMRVRAGVEGARTIAALMREAGQPEDLCSAADGHAEDIAAAEGAQRTALKALAVLAEALLRIEAAMDIDIDPGPEPDDAP